LTSQPLKKKESREIDHGLFKCFLLLQPVYPAVYNIGVEPSVADRENAMSEAEQKRGRQRKHRHKEDEIHQPREKKAQRDRPKGREV